MADLTGGSPTSAHQGSTSADPAATPADPAATPADPAATSTIPAAGAPPIAPKILQESRETAASAARHAGVEIIEVHDPTTASALAQLFDQVWGRDRDAASIMAPEALLALVHAGSQVTVARDATGRIVGGTAAMLGLDAGTVLLHSHVTAVDSDAAGRGVGRALKWHQRQWCLERGITLVRWTFDPAIRRNAVLNLMHLGARVSSYLDDVYGPMPDERNAGLPTDRLVAAWELAAPRVLAAAGGRAASPDVDALRRTGAEVVLDIDDDGAPVETGLTPSRRLVRIPEDIEAIRKRDRDQAAAWAHALRRNLGEPLRSGFRVGGLTRDGWYVLVADRQVAELKDEA